MLSSTNLLRRLRVILMTWSLMNWQRRDTYHHIIRPTWQLDFHYYSFYTFKFKVIVSWFASMGLQAIKSSRTCITGCLCLTLKLLFKKERELFLKFWISLSLLILTTNCVVFLMRFLLIQLVKEELWVGIFVGFFLLIHMDLVNVYGLLLLMNLGKTFIPIYF